MRLTFSSISCSISLDSELCLYLICIVCHRTVGIGTSEPGDWERWTGLDELNVKMIFTGSNAAQCWR